MDLAPCPLRWPVAGGKTRAFGPATGAMMMLLLRLWLLLLRLRLRLLLGLPPWRS